MLIQLHKAESTRVKLVPWWMMFPYLLFNVIGNSSVFIFDQHGECLKLLCFKEKNHYNFTHSFFQMFICLFFLLICQMKNDRYLTYIDNEWWDHENIILIVPSISPHPHWLVIQKAPSNFFDFHWCSIFLICRLFQMESLNGFH